MKVGSISTPHTNVFLRSAPSRKRPSRSGTAQAPALKISPIGLCTTQVYQSSNGGFLRARKFSAALGLTMVAVSSRDARVWTTTMVF